MAAESHVDRSIMDTSPFVTTNVVGTQVLVDVARDQGVSRLCHVSADEVYGSLPLDDRSTRFSERTPLAPNSPYAATKAASDLLVRAAHEAFAMDVVTARCSNNLGPYQLQEKVFPLFVTHLLQDRPVPLYGDGRDIRDWIHVEDHCEAVLAVLGRGQPGGVYNSGGGKERSNLELTRMILEIMGKDESCIQHVRDRPGHDLRYAMDIPRISRDLGWEPTRSTWPEALADTVRWYRENKSWWHGVRGGAHRSCYRSQYESREISDSRCVDG